MIQKVQRFRQIIHDLGLLNGCLFGLARLLGTIFGGRVRLHKYSFVAQPIAPKPWLPGRRGAALEIRRIDESDPLTKEFPRPEWAIPYRFSQGAICLGALKQGKCIGFLWFTLGPYQEDEVRCRYIPLPQGKSAWDFDVYLDPEHRNGVAFLKLWDAANSLLAQRGCNWSLSRISAFNRNSFHSHARMGAKQIGSSVFLCVGALQLCAATIPPYFHFSTNPRSFPVFALNTDQIMSDS